ncbi:ABC transporter ATP-binding protein [Propionibacteriaceae bacterium Y2011]|uniref:ABC transporter ATP-binding protein n=1 Tax=Microlunatus sp. Y2014 TaxID=3418488 RepID=UPI003B4413CC
MAVRTTGLTKRFGRHTAVGGIDLAVPVGSVYGFLGPNGSGKTTTIRMLVGLVAPDAGTVEVLGQPTRGTTSGSVLSRVGCLIEGPAFHPHLSGRANLRRLDTADIAADPATAGHRIGAALERVGLSHVADKRFRAYSLGMKQRLAIAGALLQPRDLLILDEPTNGLDPQGTREIRHLVADLTSDGTTVLVSTHLLAEVEQICSHVGVMSTGKLVAQGTLAEVRGAHGRIRVDTTDATAATTTLTRLGVTELTTTSVARGRNAVGAELSAVAGVRPADLAAAEVVAALVADGVPVEGFEARQASLEDEFIELTGAGFDVA